MEVDTQTLKGICSELVLVREERVVYGRAWSQARLKKARSRRSSVQESLILDQVNLLSRRGSSIRPSSPLKLLKDSDSEKWKFELFFFCFISISNHVKITIEQPRDIIRGGNVTHMRKELGTHGGRIRGVKIGEDKG